MSKFLSSIFGNSHSLPFLPLSPVEQFSKQDRHWSFDIINNYIPVETVEAAVALVVHLAPEVDGRGQLADEIPIPLAIILEKMFHCIWSS